MRVQGSFPERAEVERELVPDDAQTQVATELAREFDNAPVADPPHVYGPPAGEARDTNFISDSELLSWLSEKQDGMYADLRDRMDMSRDRSKLMEDLTSLRTGIEQGASAETVLVEVNAVLDAYAGTQHEAELVELLGPMRDQLAAYFASPDRNFFLDRLRESVADAIAGSFVEHIKARVDSLGRDDQLALIEIQSLTTDIRETAQLASNLLASAAQASNTIVGNIRG